MFYFIIYKCLLQILPEEGFIESSKREKVSPSSAWINQFWSCSRLTKDLKFKNM